MSARTEGTLLGGQVRYTQLVSGHRTALEPVLLAAAVPARPGERVFEGGCGAGAALLCLSQRVPRLSGLGIERDPELAALARDNLAANQRAAITILAGDLTAVRLTTRFDHAFANPPWHGPGTASPVAGKEAAKRGGEGLIACWARALARPLRPRGTITLIAAVTRLPECLAALAAAGCGSPALLPLWPHRGEPARLVLVQGRKGGRGGLRLLAGLVLHRDGGGYTDEAEAVLRSGAALPLA